MQSAHKHLDKRFDQRVFGGQTGQLGEDLVRVPLPQFDTCPLHHGIDTLRVPPRAYLGSPIAGYSGQRLPAPQRQRLSDQPSPIEVVQPSAVTRRLKQQPKPMPIYPFLFHPQQVATRLAGQPCGRRRLRIYL
ncbi:hypothetical protein Psuf_021570 [Phytohabitans suffuscus]|uniref:Uncharacterized protein n=1 Tax=Phytohabitans suffuscus TaxID=624315 RepID=A0A6F8YFD1_9ACTN|nr:hypothetical protein [Phytohabitans suffuscus]BCB84844.1 hypothetical protein Psuf_021570 [Phytohabitans suffuscus]